MHKAMQNLEIEVV